MGWDSGRPLSSAGFRLGCLQLSRKFLLHPGLPRSPTLTVWLVSTPPVEGGALLPRDLQSPPATRVGTQKVARACRSGRCLDPHAGCLLWWLRELGDPSTSLPRFPHLQSGGVESRPPFQRHCPESTSQRVTKWPVFIRMALGRCLPASCLLHSQTRVLVQGPQGQSTPTSWQLEAREPQVWDLTGLLPGSFPEAAQEWTAVASGGTGLRPRRGPLPRDGRGRHAEDSRTWRLLFLHTQLLGQVSK